MGAPASMFMDESLAALRSRVANLRHCNPCQVMLSLASTGAVLHSDDLTIQQCGLTENAVIIVTFREGDELDEAYTALHKRFESTPFRVLIPTGREDTWTWTRE